MNIFAANLRRIYNVQIKTRTPYVPWSIGLIENSNRQLITFLRTALESQFDTRSQKVQIFSFALNLQVRTNMNLSPREIVFSIKPKHAKMFNLSSTTSSLNCEKRHTQKFIMR